MLLHRPKFGFYSNIMQQTVVNDAEEACQLSSLHCAAFGKFTELFASQLCVRT